MILIFLNLAFGITGGLYSKYTYIKNLEIIIGANLFEGSHTSFIGRFDQNDQIFMDLQYHF